MKGLSYALVFVLAGCAASWSRSVSWSRWRRTVSVQQDWIGNPHASRDLLADLPRARSTDPDTSHRAAKRVKASGQLRESQLAVLEAVRRWPGLTAQELAVMLDGTPVKGRSRPSGWWRYEVSRRAPELVPVHLRRGPARYCAINHTLQHVWEPACGAS